MKGEPLLLIPYTSADHACYAFQLPAYTEHFSCIAIDLPGSGESDKPAGPYSTDGYAGQVAAFLEAIGIERAHVAAVSLGAAVGIHLAARHPGPLRSLSLHSCWDTSDDYLRIVLEQWRTLASSLPTLADVVVRASSLGASRLRCTSNGRSSSTRWWNSCIKHLIDRLHRPGALRLLDLELSGPEEIIPGVWCESAGGLPRAR